MKDFLTICVFLLLFVGSSALQQGSSALKQDPPPPDILVMINVETDQNFDTAISTVLELNIPPGGSLTVLSTDRKEPLLDKVTTSATDVEWKSNLSRTLFSQSKAKPLELGRMRALIGGHFNNEDKTHNEAQIALVLTDQPNILGDVSLVKEIRKKKITVASIGFQTEALSLVYRTLAADDGHILEMVKPSDVGGFVKTFRSIIFSDSQRPCDTDKWKPPTYRRCNDDCKNICQFTAILAKNDMADYCRTECPYFKDVNETALAAYIHMTSDSPADEQDMSVTWPPIVVTISVVVMIIFLVLVSAILYQKSEKFREAIKSIAKRFYDLIPNCCRKPEEEAEEEEEGDDEEEEEEEAEEEEEEGAEEEDEEEEEEATERDPLMTVVPIDGVNDNREERDDEELTEVRIDGGTADKDNLPGILYEQDKATAVPMVKIEDRLDTPRHDTPQFEDNDRLYAQASPDLDETEEMSVL